MKKLIFFLFLILNLVPQASSQSPYQLKLNKELFISGSGLTTVIVGRTLTTTRSTFFTTDELFSLDRSDVNRFDRIAIDQFSQGANELSDVFLYGSFAIPHLLLTGQQSRTYYGQVMLLYGQTVAFNAGITMMTKSLFRRPRPYAFNKEITDEYKLSRQAKTSFISGHTSFTAMNTFFTAKVFSDCYPDSKWKPVVWVLAAAIPATTGTLRVAAGRHYPTDVIAGYAVGACIGILIPHLHRNKQPKNTGFRLDTGFNSARLSLTF